MTGSQDKKAFQVECKRLLNKKDPLDRLILDMAKKKELDVYFVDTDVESKNVIDSYSVDNIPKRRGRHTE